MTRFTKKRGVFSIKTLLILAIISILPRMEAKAAVNDPLNKPIRISDPSKPKSEWFYYVIRNTVDNNATKTQTYWSPDLGPSWNPFFVGIYAFVGANDGTANHVKIYNKSLDRWVTYLTANIENLNNAGNKKNVAYLDLKKDNGYADAEKFHLHYDGFTHAYGSAFVLEYLRADKKTGSGWYVNYYGGPDTYNPENNNQDASWGAYNTLTDEGHIWVAETVDGRIFCSQTEMTETTRPEHVYTMKTVLADAGQGGNERVSPELTWPGGENTEAHFAFYATGGRRPSQYDTTDAENNQNIGGKYSTTAVYIYNVTTRKWLNYGEERFSFNLENKHVTGGEKNHRKPFVAIYEKVQGKNVNGEAPYAYEFVPFTYRNGSAQEPACERPQNSPHLVTNYINRFHLSTKGYNSTQTLSIAQDKPTNKLQDAIKSAWILTETGPDTRTIKDDQERDRWNSQKRQLEADPEREAKYNKEYTFKNYADFNVTLNREFKANKWNTICTPFEISSHKLSKAFGRGYFLREFSGVKVENGRKVMYFKPVTEIKAKKPYLIMPQTDKTNPMFENVIFIESTTGDKITFDGISMVGVYGPTRLKEDGTNIFVGSDGYKFKKPTPLPDNQTRGLRAYFEVPYGTNTTTLRTSIFDDVTGIEDVEIVIEDDPTDAPVFNIHGQRVGTGLKGLKPGIYIMGGKKYVVK